MIGDLKKSYKKSYEDLKKSFLSDHNNSKFLRSHSNLIDQLLKKLWVNCGINNESSLIAVGGYGRKELFPYSDIDILVLVDSSLNSTEKIEIFITQCWDIGLKIGHSVRDLSETIIEFNKDVKTATNLLESRYLCGSKKIFRDLELSVRQEINPRKFYKEKIEEQNKRYNKYRDSGYQLEPNIKESPGGLRDIHTILWIANSQKNTKGLKDLNPNSTYGKEGRPARIEDGIILPKYRLPTEAEWEYAAYADGSHRMYNRVVDKNKYSWNGNETRNAAKQDRGDILANFKRGRGDNMGTSGWLNDQADITMQVRFYPPNDFGLYDMAGNVAEWVMDVYRPVSSYDVTDFRGFRGNEFKHFNGKESELKSLEVLQDPQWEIRNGDSIMVRLPGQLPTRNVTEEESATRRNYNKGDYRDYLDGDNESSLNYENPAEEGEAYMYDYGNKSLIGNYSRVYKGGSWKDRAYWLSPGTRRHLEENQSTDYIGFRCAMDRVGFQNLDESRSKRSGNVKRHNFKRYQN